MTADCRVLVTGASGFVGGAVVRRLLRDGCEVRAAVGGRRTMADALSEQVPVFSVDLGASADWTTALEGVTAVVHCAARVHVLNESASDPFAEFRRINVDATLELAEQAAHQGVRRFVFISSIGVNGASTSSRPFRADDAPAPQSAYARSKLEAEVALARMAANAGLEVVVVRPPLVYGPDAPGNFDQLLRILFRGVPLPFSAIRNRRSFVALENLVDVLVRVVRHPGVAGKTFLVSDDHDLSTPELIRRLAAALHRPARLFPLPMLVIRGSGALLRRQEMVQRLCGSLEMDISETRATLNWTPPIDVDTALQSSAQAFLKRVHA